MGELTDACAVKGPGPEHTVYEAAVHSTRTWPVRGPARTTGVRVAPAGR